ncbi:MAG: SDR family NAD(P)-dependent oxidoreductase [Verrucomicrobiota bacterium]
MGAKSKVRSLKGLPEKIADDPWRLDGQVAVITGGSSGLGLDIADVLAAAGCKIVLTSRTMARAEKSAVVLRRRHAVEALALPLELAEYRSIVRFANRAHAWRQRIDILVNNAGGGSGATAAELFQRDPAEIARTLNTNLLAVIYCCQQIGRYMVERRSGRIINVASVSGLVGRDRRLYREQGVREQPVDYAAAKAGVLGLTRDLAALLAPAGVRVNSLCPGGFDKGTLPPGFVSAYADRTPLRRMGRVGTDIKGAALFLASAASDYMTGQNLVIDGGFSAVK